MGVGALLFGGIIYAWSILKAPLTDEFGWAGSELTLNFTLTICFFCLGAFVGGMASKRLGVRLALILSGVISCTGFILASRLSGGNIVMLYISYGGLAGFGIGIAYTVIIATVSAWFPDKKGTCSGALLMGFGASALVVGNLASTLIEGPGWRMAYLAVGIALGVILVAAALLLRLPPADVQLPVGEKKAVRGGENFEAKEYRTWEMVHRLSFWLAFFCIVCLSAVGNTVISFARDLSISVGASGAFATNMVGVLSVCNGLGRIATGALFDRFGRKRTMLLANLLTITAAGITLLSVLTHSLPLCVAGLCADDYLRVYRRIRWDKIFSAEFFRDELQPDGRLYDGHRGQPPAGVQRRIFDAVYLPDRPCRALPAAEPLHQAAVRDWFRPTGGESKQLK